MTIHSYIHDFLYFTDLFVHIAPEKKWIDSSVFLERFNRGIRAVRGDGNCPFRSLSTIICGNEDNHQLIRRTLVTFTLHNKKLFQRFCYPKPIEEHISGMKNDRIWGTDLEIHAAASLWQVKIYVCQPNTTDSSYSWICFAPFPQSQIMCPRECQELLCPPGVFHFELFYASRCHFDVIIGSHGHLPDYQPELPKTQVYITL